MRVEARLSATVLVLTLASVLPFGTAAAPATDQVEADQVEKVVAPAWTLRFEQQIRWQRVHPLGTLLLASDCCVHGVDATTGKVTWTRAGLETPAEDAYDLLHGTSLFVLATGPQKNRTLVLDALDGRVVFDSQAAGIVNILHQEVLFATGGLLIMGQEKDDPTIQLFLADMATGRIRWRNDEVVGGVSAGMKKLAGLMAAFAQATMDSAPDPGASRPVEVGADAIVWASAGEIVRLSSATGEFVWRVPNREGEGTTGLFLPPSRPDLLLVGTEARGAAASNGAAAPAPHTMYQAYRLADGTPLWPRAIKVKGPLNPPVLLEAGALLSSGGGADGGIRFVEYASGASKWGKNGKGIDSDGGIVDHHPTEAGFVVTTGRDSVWSNKGTVYSLNVLDTADGSFRFPKALKAKGRLLRTEVVPKGVLYVTTHEANVFDPRTGASLLGRAVVSEGLVTADAGEVLYAYAPDDGALWAVHKGEASATRLGSDKVKLEGGDVARELEVDGDRLTLLGAQNVIGFDRAGKVLFRAYHPAPRNPGWVRALAIAQAIRMGMAAAQAGAAAASLNQYAATQDDGTLGREVADELSRGYAQIAEGAAGASGAYARIARQRYQASAEARDFQFMMVALERKYGIAQVDKASGAIRGVIPIARDKNPRYAVDDVARRVYYMPDEQSVVGFAF